MSLNKNGTTGSKVYVSERFTTLELNGGKQIGLARNWQEPIDLKIKGGIQVFKTFCVVGNIEVNNSVHVNDTINCNGNLYAGCLTSKISALNVNGNLCGDMILTKPTSIYKLTVNSNLNSNSVNYNPVQLCKNINRYGWLDSQIENSMLNAGVYIEPNKSINFKIDKISQIYIDYNTYSIQYNDTCNANGSLSHASGFYCVAPGDYSHAEGFVSTASGVSSHSEGVYTKAISEYSHSDGINTVASKPSSYAQGKNTKANGYTSHVEGLNSIVNGNISHAEGIDCIVNSDYTYVEGILNISDCPLDHIEGRNNQSTQKSQSGTTTQSGLNHIQGEKHVILNGYCNHVEGGNHIVSSKYGHSGGSSTLCSQHAQWTRSSGCNNKIGDAQTSLFHLKCEIPANTISGRLYLTKTESGETNEVNELNHVVYPRVNINESWLCEMQIVGSTVNIDELLSTQTNNTFGQKCEFLIENKNNECIVHGFRVVSELGNLTTKIKINSKNDLLIIEIFCRSEFITRWAGTLIVTQVSS